MKTYYQQLQDLRSQAIADIRTYVEDCGETVATIPAQQDKPERRYMLRVHGSYLVFGDTSATLVDTEHLFTIADGLNSL